MRSTVSHMVVGVIVAFGLSTLGIGLLDESAQGGMLQRVRARRTESTRSGDANKPRVIVLTDIENEPDDAQSLVRFLTYSNQFDVEGIIATTSVWLRDKTAEWRIHEILEETLNGSITCDQIQNGFCMKSLISFFL